MKKYFWLLAIILMPTIAGGEVAQDFFDFDPAWKRWLSEYASSSPYLVMKKTMPAKYRFTDNQFDMVFEGKTKIPLPNPIEGLFNVKPIRSLDLAGSYEALRLEVLDELEESIAEGIEEIDRIDVDRFKTMMENLKTLALNRKKDELIFVHTGLTHALDLFFSFFLLNDKYNPHPLRKVQNQIVFFRSPFDLNSLRVHPTFLEYRKRLQKPLEKMNAKFLIPDLLDGLLARILYYRSIRKDLFKKSDLLEAKPVKPGMFVFMDIHFLNAPESINEMPSLKDAKRKGFKKITLVQEGLKFGDLYDIDEFRNNFVFINPDKPKEKREDGEEVAEEEIPAEVKRWMRKNPVVWDVNARAFLDRMEVYRKEGFEISLTGLEKVNRFNIDPVVAMKEISIAPVIEGPPKPPKVGEKSALPSRKSKLE